MPKLIEADGCTLLEIYYKILNFLMFGTITPCLILLHSLKHKLREINKLFWENSQNELSYPFAANFVPQFFWLRFSILCYFFLLIGIDQLDNND